MLLERQCGVKDLDLAVIVGGIVPIVLRQDCGLRRCFNDTETVRVLEENRLEALVPEPFVSVI